MLSNSPAILKLGCRTMTKHLVKHRKKAKSIYEDLLEIYSDLALSYAMAKRQICFFSRVRNLYSKC